jgi:ABC-type sulfate transport system substrate-binding protein
MHWKALARKVVQRQHLKPPKSKNGMYEILGNWMYLDDKDSLGLSKYGIYEEGETRFIQKSLKPSFTVVDIGANIGYYTLIMAGLAKHVYAFEPEPKNFEMLEKNSP